MKAVVVKVAIGVLPLLMSSSRLLADGDQRILIEPDVAIVSKFMRVMPFLP